MKRWKTVLLTAVLCLVSASLARTAPQETHSSEKDADKKAEHSPRWAIRNGVDAGASGVSHTPKPTAISDLTKAARPTKLPPDTRVRSAETTLWQVEGDLVRYEQHDDGDIQFVLRDGKTGATLVCELPDPDEVRASPFLKEIAKARATFEKRFAPTKTTHTVAPKKVHLRVAGLGYFGRISQAGKPGLPNGAQLHPVTQVTVTP